MWSIQYTFHFSEQEMWEMTTDKLKFWERGVARINQWLKDGTKL